MKHAFVLFALSALLSACGTSSSDATGTAAAADSVAAVPGMDLAQYDLPLLFAAPDKQLTGGAEPAIAWKEEIGKLEIVAGDHFGLTIVEEPGDVARLKADLDRDLLRKNTIVQESPEMLVYKSEFPDDPNLVFIHFYQVVKSGDRSFVVEDVQNAMRFSEQDVELMSKAISAKQPT